MDVFETQRTLTSRSEKFPSASSSIRTSRPRSAALPFTSENENSKDCLRSKSEEFFNINPRHNPLFQGSSNCNENEIQGNSSLLLSDFTHSSSNLLLHLIRESDENSERNGGPSLEYISKDLANYKQSNPKAKQSVTEIQASKPNNQTDDLYEKFLKNSCFFEHKEENPETSLLDSKDTKVLEGTSDRFSNIQQNKTLNDFSLIESPHRCCHRRRKFSHVSAFNGELNQKSQDCQRYPEKTLFSSKERLCNFKSIEDFKEEDPGSHVFKNGREEEILKIENFQNEKHSLPVVEKHDSSYSNDEGSISNENSSKNVPVSPIFNFDQQVLPTTDILYSNSKNSDICNVMNRSFNSASAESVQTSDQEVENNSQLAHPHDSDSTYDEIVQLLQTLETENAENHIQEKQLEPEESGSLVEEAPKNTINHLNDVFAYLEEIEKNETSYPSPKKDFTSPCLEKLLNKTSVELAHEVLSLEIQIEDQKKGLKLLKDTIADMKEAKRLAEFEHQEILVKTNSDAEAIVKRHQKFIKQLLEEKKKLSETVSKLVQDLKSSEEKYKSNIKAMEEKHLIEVKRAKDTQAAADRIKREKWMEMKTQKIKEMTVKGLEPELTRMAAQQQQELAELRNLHRGEIEALELKAARRTAELMDQLRTELTKEKETAITDKVNSLRASMEREFEEERNKFYQNCQTLKQRIRKLEEKLSSQEEEFQMRLIETKQEIEKEKQKLVRIHQENLDEEKRRHSVELKNLRELLESDKEISLKNHEKQLAAKFLDKEAELHEQYKKERDKEIDMVIEKFEKEQIKIQTELTATAENKLKRVKEKLQTEIKELEESIDDLKTKLSQAKSEVSEKEESMTELNSQIRQMQTEIDFLRKSCEKMTCERAQLKEIIRGEFESSINDLITEKKNLQKEILDLKEAHVKELAKKDQLNLQAKNEMQKELTTVYSRIKAAISKKEKVVEALREENREINERYRQLELMLDKQRRNLLLQ